MNLSLENVLIVVLAVTLLMAAAAAAAYAFASRRPAAPSVDPAALQALESVSRDLGQVRSELSALGRTQADLRQEALAGREASWKGITDATQHLHSQIGMAHQALAEVRAIEESRSRQAQSSAESLRRLEAVVAGAPTRGAAGENILMRTLAQLPPDLLETNVSFGNKTVEYAVRLPGNRYLPIDSKWTSAASLEKLALVEDHAEHKKLVEQVCRDVRSRAREMAKYLDPERTLAMGILALPDSVYAAAPEAQSECYREGILLVPYSLALSYVLTVYRLALRFGAATDTNQLAARLRALDETLRKMDEEIESRLSRGLVQVENSRDALRQHIAGAHRMTERLLRTAESPEELAAAAPSAAAPAPAPVQSQPRLALVDRE